MASPWKLCGLDESLDASRGESVPGRSPTQVERCGLVFLRGLVVISGPPSPHRVCAGMIRVTGNGLYVRE
jgi:hypothetical protein